LLTQLLATLIEMIKNSASCKALISARSFLTEELTFVFRVFVHSRRLYRFPLWIQSSSIHKLRFQYHIKLIWKQMFKRFIVKPLCYANLSSISKWIGVCLIKDIPIFAFLALQISINFNSGLSSKFKKFKTKNKIKLNLTF